jgi:hypothetical protein
LHVSDFSYKLQARTGVVVAVVGGQHPPGMKGTTMELLVLAIIVIVGFSLYFVIRARAAR